MAFEKFTDRARKVVDLASAEATRLGDDSVDTIHLLIGMLREGEGVAGKVLADFDIAVDTILDAHKSSRTKPEATLDDVESSCLSEAKWFGHHYVGTEHLLLGVCCLKDCRAAKLLDDIGKPPVELCQLVVDVAGHRHEWNRWLEDHPGLSVDS